MSLAATVSEECSAPGPIVKWAGGKSRLLPELVSRTPKRFGRYFEPFFGGGALFFRLLPERAVLSDLNADLMKMYRCVALNAEPVIWQLQYHAYNHSTGHYYLVRDAWNEHLRDAASGDGIAHAAGFIYLNKTCYNGLYRVNRRGHFNVPMGRYERPLICDADGLRAASQVLQHAEIRRGTAHWAVSDAMQGDFVYFDPPYVPVSKTARFTSYTTQGFTESDQRELAELVQELTDRGVCVMLSNSDTPLIRDLYQDFRIDTVKAARAINSRANGRSSVDEVIVTNGYL